MQIQRPDLRVVESNRTGALMFDIVTEEIAGLGAMRHCFREVTGGM